MRHFREKCLYCGRSVPKNRLSSWCSAKCVSKQDRADRASARMEREIQEEQDAKAALTP